MCVALVSWLVTGRGLYARSRHPTVGMSPLGNFMAQQVGAQPPLTSP
jgi:hypothetical protein